MSMARVVLVGKGLWNKRMNTGGTSEETYNARVFTWKDLYVCWKINKKVAEAAS